MDLRADINNDTLTAQNRTYQGDGLSIPPKIIVISIVFWTLFANGAIVLCFIRNKHNAWTTYSRPVLSLSINDISLSVASFFMVVIPFMSTADKVQCSIAFYFFFSAQCAVLNYILVLCIHRLVSIQKRTFSIIAPFSGGAMISLPWFLSFIICALPFLFWNKVTGRHEVCSAMTIVKHQNNAAKFMVLAYILPLILTNFLHVFVVFRLYYSLGRVKPIQTVEMSSYTDGRQKALFKLHLRVVGTVGIILLITDACTVPLIAIYTSWWASGYVPHSRDVRYFGSYIFLMKTALNPFVYVGRTKNLREALKLMWKEIFTL